MSKWAAIDTAVRLQLAADGREIDYRKAYGAAANGPDSVNLPVDGIQKFLMDVANRLRLDKPPLNFAWRKIAATAIDGQKLGMIVAIVEDETEEPKPT